MALPSTREDIKRYRLVHSKGHKRPLLPLTDKLREELAQCSKRIEARRTGPPSKIEAHPRRHDIELDILRMMPDNDILAKYDGLGGIRIYKDNLTRHKRKLRAVLIDIQEEEKDQRRASVRNRIDECYDLAIGSARKADEMGAGAKSVATMLDQAGKMLDRQINVEGLGTKEHEDMGPGARMQIGAVINKVIALPKQVGVEDEEEYLEEGELLDVEDWEEVETHADEA